MRSSADSRQWQMRSDGTAVFWRHSRGRLTWDPRGSTRWLAEEHFVERTETSRRWMIPCLSLVDGATDD